MLLPRMTTRSWMVAVLAAGLSLVGHRYVGRLAHERDRRLARAAWHVEQEAGHRRAVVALRRGPGGIRSYRTPAEASVTSEDLDRVIAQRFGVEVAQRSPGDRPGRPRVARPRASGPRGRRRRIPVHRARRQAVRHRRLADYHGGLVRK